jgi:hypothetical protein
MGRSFGGTFHFHLQGKKSAEQETSVQQVAKQMEATLPFETLVYVRTT